MNKTCNTFFFLNLFSDSNQPSATVTFVRVSGTEEGDSPSTSTTNGKNYFLAHYSFFAQITTMVFCYENCSDLL